MTGQPTALELIQRSYSEPAREARATLLTAIELADAENDLDLGFSARSNYISNCLNEPDQLMMIAHYGWNLARHDEDSERFPISLWEYKWVVDGARGYTGVSREQLTELADDLAQRFEQAGSSKGPAGVARCDIASSLGDLAALEGLLETWLNTPRTGWLNDCSTCDITSEVYFRITLGQYEQAIQAGEPVISGGRRCASQPHYAFANLLEAARKTNNVELATDLSERGLDLIRSDPDFTGPFGQHLSHFAITGQLDRGLEVLRRMAPLIAGDDADMMDFARGASLLLRLADQEGAPDLEELHEQFDGKAEALAALFDKRNGNSVTSSKIAAEIAELEAGWPPPGDHDE